MTEGFAHVVWRSGGQPPHPRDICEQKKGHASHFAAEEARL